MKNTLLNLLYCPACHGDLQIHDKTDIATDGHVMTGHLQCNNCHALYPIVTGVPRFVPASTTTEVSATVEGFGYEWKHANPLIQNTQFVAAETFLDFIYPIQADYFKGKIILDAGCGTGRFIMCANEFGANAVIGVDLSESVEVAFQNTRHLSNVLIVQADLFSMPLRPIFDYAYSVGVLHHTSNPRRAFAAVANVVKSGGGISAWVYGRENNGWIVNFVNPIRKHLTSRLPRSVLLILAYLMTVPLFLLLKGIYRPVGKYSSLNWLRKYLFYFDYFYFLGGFGFHEQAYIVFDHLVPALAEYIAYEDFKQWFADNQMVNVTITHRHRMSWRGFGERPF